MLELRARPVHKADSLLDLLLESGLSLGILENPGFTTAFFCVLSADHAALQYLEKFITIHDIVDIFNRFLHAKVDGCCEYGIFVVTREKPHVGMGIVQIFKGFVDIFAQRVGKASSSNVAKVALKDLTVLILLKVQ